MSAILDTNITPADYRKASTPSGKHEPIIVFKGGGYDGCIWEWNIIVFGPAKDGRREIAYSKGVSGYAGKRVLEAAKTGGLRAAWAAAQEEDDCALVTHDASWQKFNDDFNKGFVRNAAKAAGRACQCDRCKKWFSPEEVYHTGYRGDGGVGVQYDDNYCLECAEEICGEHDWKCASVSERVEAIQRYRDEEGADVSIFAARRDTPCIPNHYFSQPDLY